MTGAVPSARVDSEQRDDGARRQRAHLEATLARAAGASGKREVIAIRQEERPAMTAVVVYERRRRGRFASGRRDLHQRLLSRGSEDDDVAAAPGAAPARGGVAQHDRRAAACPDLLELA